MNKLEQYRNGFREEIDESFHTNMKNKYFIGQNKNQLRLDREQIASVRAEEFVGEVEGV